MSKCIAITKRGIQCKNNKNGKLFCGIHIKSKIDKVILDGDDEFGHQINFIDEATYFKTLENIKTKQFENTKHNNAQNEKHILEQQIKLDTYNNIKTCNVCFDEVETRDNLIECSSSNPELPHIVCKSCLLGNITSMLNDGIASTECMFEKSDKCSGCYNEIQINTSIGKDNQEMMEKWNDTILSTDIVKLAGICDNYLICPLCCHWGCIFEPPAGFNGALHPFNIPCGKCNDSWCTLCKRKAHGGRTCYELYFNIGDNLEVKGKVIDKMLQDIVMRALTLCCTICGCTYIKEEGCNLMTCPKCSGMSCYICGMKLYYKGNTKYWHFTGHALAEPGGICPLWNNKAGDGKINQGNTEYNMQVVEKEFTAFIKSNHSKDINKLIKERIRGLFGKDKEYKAIVARL